MQEMQSQAQDAQMPQEPVAAVATQEKMSKKQIIGMTILSAIALAGVLFGVYGMTDSNTKTQQIEKLKIQITEATGQKTELETDKITITDEAGTITEITDAISNYRNPVIKSPGETEDGYKGYKISFKSSQTNDYDGRNMVSIEVRDGKITSCSTGFTENLGDGRSVRNLQDCNIVGLSGDIYKIVEIGAGHDHFNNQIAFIMTDGTVQYFPLFESIKNNNFEIKGKLDIKGYVVDAFDILVGYDGTVNGWGSTIFVLNDGSIIEYDEAMLK